jgi:hypothetical protein
MPVQKLKLSRPNRLAHRLVKTANALNSMAELMAETVVAIQDAARECIRLSEEIEEKAKEAKS